jgi:Zn-dependent protease with chaperone function
VITALILLGYAACAAWCAPALLAPLTRRGASVRAGLAAWLAAMASVLASVALAVSLSVAAAAADWPRLTQALCQSVAGAACTPGVYRSLLYQAGVTVLAAVLVLASVAALCRYTRRVQRSGSRTRAHARTALLVGHAIADPATAVAARPAGSLASARTVMLDDPRPAAYCVAGRPAAIVVTSGALAVLDPPQLGAVLAHERAHLVHGDHFLRTLTQGLAAVFPAIPLFARGAAEVARLTEMAADDTAARASGRQALVAALLAIATGTAVQSAVIQGRAVQSRTAPGSMMAAAAYAVSDRVDRLLRPVSPATSVAFAGALTLALALLAAAPLALTFLAVK